MSNINDALQHARSDAQDLHKKIEAATTKNNTAIRADVQKAGERAKSLAESLKSIVDAQRADGKQHVKQAISELEDAAKHAHTVATASEAQLKQTNLAMLEKAGDAVHNLSRAVAAQRAAMAKA